MSYAEITNTITSLKTQTNAVNYENNKTKDNDTVDQNVFLQLMVTQLQNQDPLDPMDNTEFLSQQAQFTQVTTLQEMQESLSEYGDALLSMNNAMLGTTSLSQAMNVVGKEVTVTDPDNENATLTGVVDSVKVDDDGNVLLSIDGKEVSSSSIKSISNASTTSSTETTEEDTALKDSAKDFLSEVLSNPKLKAAATNLIEKYSGDLL